MDGAELVREFDPQTFSGIVSFRTPQRKLAEIHRAFKKSQLTCALRGDAIRLSPHFYQVGEPIYEILNMIESNL